ncbi:T-cell surface glycoprotein CD3 delta chain-like [Mugil cephalus]|uniref:T-cell surface glycoprotein CD3 delta chain-like n=1 Tax=Mugil cephalus TaxID=48193 RepID=UPI001FB79FB3|nr:T-cell surface glycoprotein CD3 delta chain-like [Mugil cephalus]
MKRQLVLSTCALLLWTLTAFVSYAEEPKSDVVVVELPDGIKLSCNNNATMKFSNGIEHGRKELKLGYSDDNTGEYTCEREQQTSKILVTFRTCDNCVELDKASIAGIVVGDVVATIVIGVAVYLIASKAGTGAVATVKKRSDKRPLVSNEESSRGPNEHYQPLRTRGQKDTYDVLHKT